MRAVRGIARYPVVLLTSSQGWPSSFSHWRICPTSDGGPPRPQVAHAVTAAADGSSSYRDVPVTEVQTGDLLLVRPSEIVAVDGELLSDSGTFDDSSLTRESLPVSRERGDEVYSGSISGDLAVEIRALRSSADSQYQQIVELVKDAAESRAPVVRLADRFALPFSEECHAPREPA